MSNFSADRPSLSSFALTRRLMLIATAGVGASPLLGCDRVTSQPPKAATSDSGIGRVELESAARQGELCSPANAKGVGLRGEYFANQNCDGQPLLTRIDPVVDFDTSWDWPAELKGKAPASVRWSGWVKPPLAGQYRFHCDASGARLLVSRVALVGEGATTDAHIELAAGRFAPLVLELRDLSNVAGRVRLEWTAPFGARYVIPRQLLHLPSDTVSTPART